MKTSQCTRCGREVPGYEGVNQSDGKGGSLGFVCGRCWAAVLSEHTGESVGHVEAAALAEEIFEELRDGYGIEIDPPDVRSGRPRGNQRELPCGV